MVLGSAGLCPVCGSGVPDRTASQAAEMRGSDLGEGESKESLNLPFGLSNQGSNAEGDELPFGIEDAPITRESANALPFGIEEAPNTPAASDSLNALPFGLEDAPVSSDTSNGSRPPPDASGPPDVPSSEPSEASTPPDEPSTTSVDVESVADGLREPAQSDSANPLPFSTNSSADSADQLGGISASTKVPDEAGKNPQDSADESTHPIQPKIAQKEVNSLPEKGRIEPSKLPYGIDHMHHTLID